MVFHKHCRTRRADIEQGIKDEWERLTSVEKRMWWYITASAQKWNSVSFSFLEMAQAKARTWP
jgi:hypothetical protein